MKFGLLLPNGSNGYIMSKALAPYISRRGNCIETSPLKRNVSDSISSYP